MKPLFVAILVLISSIESNAQNMIKNGDFNDGINHWNGDGLRPEISDAAQTINGIIVQLKPHWTCITQDFRALTPTINVKVTYQTSADLLFSRDPQDYQHVELHSFEGGKFDQATIGNSVAFIADLARHGFDAAGFVPRMNAGVQQVNCTLKGFVPGEGKTFCLAFPPGKGTITVLSVSLTD